MYKQVLCILASVLMFSGCQGSLDSPKEEDSTIHFSIYGTVFDSSGYPVNGAQISLYEGLHFQGCGTCIGSYVSGLDGQYKIPCSVVREKNVKYSHFYQLEVHCSGYQEYSESLTIMETEGLEMQVDVKLK